MYSIIVGLVLLWLVLGLSFAIYVVEKEHKECVVLRARVAELIAERDKLIEEKEEWDYLAGQLSARVAELKEELWLIHRVALDEKEGE